jgi:hypothetical protein
MVFKRKVNPNSDGGDDFDAWGMGQRFVIVKYLNPLKEFTYAAKQARFGIVEGQSEFNYPSFKTENRLNGLDHMYFIMITLSYDVYPFLDKYAKNDMLVLRNRIKIVKQLLKFVKEDITDDVNHVQKYEIKEDVFEKCFENLLDINTHMIQLMNRTGFIFRLNNEFNMDDFEDDVIHGG